MKDRIPTKPGRIQLVPSPDGDDLFILTRADEPTQVGTPLNKASLLSDATAAMLSLTGDPTVDDALAYIAERVDMIKHGPSAPSSSTAAHLGDIYIQDDGGPRRTVYICDANGDKPADVKLYWERGTLTARGENAAADYRVRCDLARFPAGAKLTVASGFRFMAVLFNEDRSYKSAVAFRTADYTFSAAEYARITVARVTEDTSETANVNTFSGKLSVLTTGRHWTRVGSVKEVQKQVIITTSGWWNVPDDLTGAVTVRAFGGGAGGSSAGASSGYGGGGGQMRVWTGTLSKRRYEITIGAGGSPGGSGGSTKFGTLLTAPGGSGQNGGSGGGGDTGGNGSYGGGGGGRLGNGGNGGTYGGGGGGGSTLEGGAYHVGGGGSGKSGAFSGGAGYINGSGSVAHGGGGGGWTANGAAATSSANGNGGAGQSTEGFSLEFEGAGQGGAYAGGGGGFGGSGGDGGSSSGSGGGGGGYGADGGSGGGTHAGYGAGGGGGWGGRGGDGNASGSGGGGGYGLSGRGGDGGQNGGLAAGGGQGASGGPGVVVITYTGVEAV